MRTVEPRSHDGTALQHWDDPEQSCGRHFHSIPSGESFWEAVGPAANEWSNLSREIKGVVDALDPKDATLSVHMFMIGQSRQTSSPKVMLCTKDFQIQTEVCDALLRRGIMEKYPLIGMRFCSNPPVPLANDELAWGVQQETPTPLAVGGEDVWATDCKGEFGRRLYILRPDGGPPRVATGGPILFVGSITYQTTVRHVFLESEEVSSEPLPSFVTDLELEQSDSDSDSYTDNGGNYDADSVEDRDGPAIEGSSLHHKGLPHQLDSTHPAEHLSPMFAPASSSMSLRATLDGERAKGKGKEPEIPRGAVRIGALASVPTVGAEGTPDYALVKLEAYGGSDYNLVSCGPSGYGKEVRVTKAGQIGAVGLSRTVVVATSSGPVGGKLSASPSFIKPKGQRECQEVYAVKVDDGHSLGPGDCGSGVIDTRTGEIFGHIVSGHQGTHVAYILPMEKIIKDIASELNQDVSFHPTPYDRHPIFRAVQYFSWEPTKHLLRDNAVAEPLIFTEFASPKFHKNVTGQKMPKKHRLRGLCETIRGRTATIKAATIKAATVKVPELRRIRFWKKRNETFESRFFALPPEIRDQIIKELPFGSAMNLRQVSKAWRAAVSVNASAILKRFPKCNPLPQLAQQLYSNESPDLQYIQGVGHRHAVASRLAEHIARWLRQEMYLYRSNHQQQSFQETERKIRQRLVPPLFAALHFFEMYPQSLLQHLHSQQQLNDPTTGHGATSFPFELTIMEMYSDDILLQTHQVFEILMTFLCRILRPPSYYGHIEKWLRGYLCKPPSEKVHVAILCIGGLDAIVQFANIADYMQRMSAVGRFYSSLTNGGSSSLISRLQPEEMQLLLRHLPNLDDVWRRTGRALLLERGIISRREVTPRREVIPRREGVDKYSQALAELLRPDETLADRLYDGHVLWHALSDRNFSNGDEPA